jgi:hypothetical protein
MLQAGKSPVQVPDELDFFNVPNHLGHTMALRSTQPLKEISTRNLLGKKRRLRTEHLKMWDLQPLTTLKAPTACTVITLPSPYLTFPNLFNFLSSMQQTWLPCEILLACMVTDL